MFHWLQPGRKSRHIWIDDYDPLDILYKSRLLKRPDLIIPYNLTHVLFNSSLHLLVFKIFRMDAILCNYKIHDAGNSSVGLSPGMFAVWLHGRNWY